MPAVVSAKFARVSTANARRLPKAGFEHGQARSHMRTHAGGVVGLLCCCGIGYYLYTTSQDGAAAYGADEEDAGEEEALPPPKPRDIENPSGA